MILEFATKYFSWFKHVPYLPLLLDQFVKIETFIFHRERLDLIDRMTYHVSSWPHVRLSLHRFGGIEFTVDGHEFGHIHSNGLLDILFPRSEREQMVRDGMVNLHHVYPDSGWISFYIRTNADVEIAIAFLRKSYQIRSSFDRVEIFDVNLQD
jgi:hypothetical protein